MARAQGPDAIEGTFVYQTTEEHLVASADTVEEQVHDAAITGPLRRQFDGLSPYVETGLE